MNYYDEYEHIINQKKDIANDLKQLENNEIITKYFKLKKNYNYLLEKQKELFKKIKINEYLNCKHVLISTDDNNLFENSNSTSNACIKCGLNDAILKHEKETLSYENQVMYDFLSKNTLLGTSLDINCEINFATSLYKKIKDRNPNIDDETAVEMFKNILVNMSNNNSQKRK